MSAPGVAVLVLISTAGCYSGNRVSRGINQAWVGHSRAELQARWGAPASVSVEGDTTVLQWSHRRHHVELPSADASLTIGPDGFDASASITEGRAWTTTTDVRALVSPTGDVLRVEGPSLRWGPPRGANLRWGTVLGLHAGMGRLDDTGTPLPSGGLYIGGMLGPRLALIGNYLMVAGKDDAGGAIDFAWGMAAQWWPLARLAVHAGPALVLDLDPGFEDAALGPGATAGVSVAVIRAGAFVLDLRLDAAAGLHGGFGTLGVGVNAN